MVDRRGFTLIEMTLVIVIIAIAMAVVVPLIDGGLTSREVRRGVRQIAGLMNHLRNEAVSTGKPTGMVIDVEENTVKTVGGGPWEVLSDRATIEAVAAEEIDTGRFLVRFFPNGSNSGAAVVLTSSADRTRNRLRLELDPLIGSVQVGDAPL
jgi:general secretion pathway protein H